MFGRNIDIQRGIPSFESIHVTLRTLLKEKHGGRIRPPCGRGLMPYKEKVKILKLSLSKHRNIIFPKNKYIYSIRNLDTSKDLTYDITVGKTNKDYKI